MVSAAAKVAFAALMLRLPLIVHPTEEKRYSLASQSFFMIFCVAVGERCADASAAQEVYLPISCPSALAFSPPLALVETVLCKYVQACAHAMIAVGGC